jgi:glycine/D-amino acid oxidase-like deaminating enzyme/nitrite reductase/ring-hydroxylating ferredoxin subunit
MVLKRRARLRRFARISELDGRSIFAEIKFKASAFRHQVVARFQMSMLRINQFHMHHPFDRDRHPQSDFAGSAQYFSKQTAGVSAITGVRRTAEATGDENVFRHNWSIAFRMATPPQTKASQFSGVVQMHSDSGQTTSVWMNTAASVVTNSLQADIDCDVCIIGAGIAGLSVAYHLAKQNKKVVVLDDGPIAGGETCRTTAHLTNAIDDRYHRLEQVHGLDGARLAAESHTRAIDRIGEIIAEEQIDCDFRRVDGYLFQPPGADAAGLDKELAAAHRCGLTDVQKVERAPIESFNTGPALLFPRQGQFHITKYLRGLTNAIHSQGGRIFTGTHVTEIQAGTPALVMTSAHARVKAAAIVVATNVPVNDRVEIHTKQMPYRTYIVGAVVPRGSIMPALFWDDDDPYHYVRVQSAAEGDILIVGGEDHKTGQANDANRRFARLEAWARERWPQIESIAYRWSGQVIETQDYLAFIGRNPFDDDNIYIATGDSGMGMTHGTIAGMLISDLILGRSNPWEKLYDPGRVRVASANEFLKENLNTFAQYKEHFTAGDLADVTAIPPGEGAIIRRGLNKVAVYHSAEGAFVACSAVCPHLGAVAQWNSLEKSWDCPAHGSRFTAHGSVTNGPANSGLKRLESQEEESAA